MIKNKNKKNIVWCELNDKPCVHSTPDDLENCRFCEEYTFDQYLKFKEKEREKIKNGN